MVKNPFSVHPLGFWSLYFRLDWAGIYNANYFCLTIGVIAVRVSQSKIHNSDKECSISVVLKSTVI